MSLPDAVDSLSRSRIQHIATCLAVAFACALAQTGIYDRSIIPLDEGQLINTGARIVAGEVLYRDIYTGIAPFSYYLTAAWLWLFGDSVVATRILQVGLNAATAGLLWAIGTRSMSGFWALLAPVLFTGTLLLSFPIYTMLAYSSVGLVTSLAAALFLLRYLETGRLNDGIGLGLFIALTALTKQNYGVYIGVATVFALVLCRRDLPSPKTWLQLFAPVVVTGLVLALGTVAASLSAGAFLALIDATVLTIFGAQLTAFNQPMPPILGPHPENDGFFVFLYSPGAIFNYLIRGAELFGSRISTEFREALVRIGYGSAVLSIFAGPVLAGGIYFTDGAQRARRSLVIAVFAGLFFLGIFPSCVWSHLASVIPPLFIAMGIACDLLERMFLRLGSLGSLLKLGLRSLLIVTALAVTAFAFEFSTDLRAWNSEPLNFARSGVTVTADRAQLITDSVEFLRACAKPNEPVFVAPDMPIVYYLAERRNPTPFDLTIPGNVDGPAIVETLIAQQINCVVYNRKMYVQFGKFSEIFPKLVAHLETAYEKVGSSKFGGQEWHFLSLRKSPAPQSP